MPVGAIYAFIRYVLPNSIGIQFGKLVSQVTLSVSLLSSVHSTVLVTESLYSVTTLELLAGIIAGISAACVQILSPRNNNGLGIASW